MQRIHRERAKNNHTVRQATKNIVNFAIRHMPRSKERDNSIADITCPGGIPQRKWSSTLKNANERRFKQLINVAVEQAGFDSILEDDLAAISECTNAGFHRRISSILVSRAPSIEAREEIYRISRKSGITEEEPSLVIKGAAINTFLISSYVVVLFSHPRLLFHHDCE